MIQIDSTYTLFLDRDGVINKKINDGYVLSLDDFEFLPGVLDVMPKLAKLFTRIVVVTNQQCIAKDNLLRKPNNGMALLAKNDFPEIDFTKSIMVGDHMTDMEFGKSVGMTTFYISSNYNEHPLVDFSIPFLQNITDYLIS